jgi:hypothetical protein
MRVVDRATDSLLRVVKEADDIDRECGLCATSEWSFRLVFGFDGNGPWAVLGCSEDGCETHEALRPVWSKENPTYREDELLAVLLDFAQEDGWEIANGAWCPVHHPEA